MDKQVVGILGCQWLTGRLFQAGIEVAQPLRDRGIDLVAYNERPSAGLDTFMRPIQVKSSTKESFGLDRKYEQVPGLLLVYVWNLNDADEVKGFALTYSQAFSILQSRDWHQSNSWTEDGRYAVTAPNEALRTAISKYEITDLSSLRAKVQKL